MCLRLISSSHQKSSKPSSKPESKVGNSCLDLFDCQCDTEAHIGLADSPVAALLEAADDSPVEKKRDLSSVIGTPDDALKVLVQHAAHLIRTMMVNKVQTQASQTKPRGRPKKDTGLAAGIAKDRFAMECLDELIRSSALSINCVMTPHRANLTWHLQNQVLSLVAPAFAPSQPQHMPHGINHFGAQSPVPVEAALAAAQAHQQGGFYGPPPPHQFLFRHPSDPNITSVQNMPQSPLQNLPPAGQHSPPQHINHMLMNRAQTFDPSYLPRSGQSMKFSFQPQTPVPMSPNGTQGVPMQMLQMQMGPPALPRLSHPGAAGLENVHRVLPGVRTHMGHGGGGAAGFLHPGAVVQDM